jgi:hypothetical protein
MVEYIYKHRADGKSHLVVKLHAKVKNFRRVESFKYQGHFYNIHLDKNDSVCGVEKTEVLSWKEVVKNKRKIRVPDEVQSSPEPYLLNKVKGNPYKIACDRIITEIERGRI